MVLRRILTCRGRWPRANRVTAQNGKQPIRLPSGLLYRRVEVEQRAHSGDDIAQKNGCISSHYEFHGLQSNANRRKMAVPLALIQEKIS